MAEKEFRNWVVKPLDPFSQAVRTIKKRYRNIGLSFSLDSMTKLKTADTAIPESEADFGTVESVKEHGGFGASELSPTRCGITESEPFLRILCIELSSRVSI
ncbi:hypothetical protein TNCV_1466761 [Trichonephila clavipes]|nr:hypothetical protein TNCV_1466761 [Trichonephila clavipes]